MKINEAKKIMKLETTKERENAFYTLYDVDGQKEVLEQFQAKVTALKLPKRASKAKVQEQYINLLELVLEYSHAIFFLYSKDRINKNINAFKKMALAVIREENVIKAFKQFNRLYDYREQNQEPQEPQEPQEQIIIDSDCLALEHIDNLQKELDNDITVSGGSVEDKKAYMKFAIIALATGATASEITDSSYSIDLKKTSLFDSDYVGQLIGEIREYQETRQKPLSERGIRNGVEKLKLAITSNMKEKIEGNHTSSLERYNVSLKMWESGDKEGRKPLKPKLTLHCSNFYDLNSLYIECLTTKKKEKKD